MQLTRDDGRIELRIGDDDARTECYHDERARRGGTCRTPSCHSRLQIPEGSRRTNMKTRLYQTLCKTSEGRGGVSSTPTNVVCHVPHEVRSYVVERVCTLAPSGARYIFLTASGFVSNQCDTIPNEMSATLRSGRGIDRENKYETGEDERAGRSEAKTEAELGQRGGICRSPSCHSRVDVRAVSGE